MKGATIMTTFTDEALKNKLEEMKKENTKVHRKGKVNMLVSIKEYVDKYGQKGLNDWLKMQKTAFGKTFQYDYVEACKDVQKLIR